RFTNTITIDRVRAQARPLQLRLSVDFTVDSIQDHGRPVPFARVGGVVYADPPAEKLLTITMQCPGLHLVVRPVGAPQVLPQPEVGEREAGEIRGRLRGHRRPGAGGRPVSAPGPRLVGAGLRGDPPYGAGDLRGSHPGEAARPICAAPPAPRPGPPPPPRRHP